MSVILAASSGPCDIYASANTPCVAAHSTTRALFSSYDGPLYQVVRSSDNTSTNVSPLTTGGVANSATQDAFCAGTDCYIQIIFDQTSNHNDLSRAGPGGAAEHEDNLANATAAPVLVGGHKAYGVAIVPETGYRNDETIGVAVADEPEGMYGVFNGHDYNDICCFDYGNAETDNTDDGAGAMEAIYFGSHFARIGNNTGPGPFIMVDMENALVSSLNTPNPGVQAAFVHAFVKGEHNHYAIRGADATKGSLTTFYDGPRPSGRATMYKQGAIILGIGGDNSDNAQGIFYEGVMTSGFPTNATENKVHANVVAAEYAVYT